MPSSSPRAEHRPRCPQCRRTLQRTYTLRGLLWAVVCFPCGMFCCMRRLRRRCAACERDVIISDGGVPTVARTYNTFTEFMWQFPPSALSRIGQKNGNNHSSRSSSNSTRRTCDHDENDHHEDSEQQQQQTLVERENLCAASNCQQQR